MGFIASLEDEAVRKRALDIVLEHELEDAQTSRWIAGAEDFVLSLQAANIPCAIVTRNCRAATRLKVKNNNIPIDMIITREDAPAKPDPSALNLINDKWKFQPHQVAYIGDYKYDIQAAHNANMQAWLFTYHPGKKAFELMLSFIEQL